MVILKVDKKRRATKGRRGKCIYGPEVIKELVKICELIGLSLWEALGLHALLVSV